jgi:carboxyl-terminal processing protease
MMGNISPIFLGLIAGAGLTFVTTQPNTAVIGSSARAALSDTYYQLTLFGEVFERVRTEYVDKPDDSKLIGSAINGMLTGLDPHSSYMDPDSFHEIELQTRGEYGGLGIELTMEDGLLKVVAPIDDTPAAKAGVMANDIITKLNDEQAHGLTLNQAAEKMRGPVNSKIKLTNHTQGAGQADRSHDGARRNPREVGALAYRGRRGWLCPYHRIQRANHRRSEEGDRRSEQSARGRQDQRLRHRSA